MPPGVLRALPAGQAADLVGKTFFPHLMAPPFGGALELVFVAPALISLGAAAASWLRGKRYVYEEESVVARNLAES